MFSGIINYKYMRLETTLYLAFSDGDSLADTLGIVAIVAFISIASWIVVTLLIDAHRKQAIKAGQEQKEAFEARRKKMLAEAFEGAVVRLEKEYSESYQDIIEAARTRLNDLITRADSALSNVSLSYAQICRNPESEHIDALKDRFCKLCEMQWSYFKSNLGYIGYREIEPLLNMILKKEEHTEFLGKANGNEDSEVSTAASRLQEMVAIQKTIPPERMGTFQMEAIDAIEPIKCCFDGALNHWLEDTLMEIGTKFREKSPEGATIEDTELKARFVRLKRVLEVVAKLSERLKLNTQNVGKEDAAFNQIVYGGTISSILSELPEWFTELGGMSDEAEEVLDSEEA